MSLSFYSRKTTFSGLMDCCYCNNMFIAVGKAGSIWTSQDSINWTNQTSGTSNTLESVTYGNGLYITVGDSGTILISQDGINWTKQVFSQYNPQYYDFYSVVYGKGQFLIVGWTGTVSAIYSSTDGINWKQVKYDNNMNYTDICYGDGIFLTSPYVYTSTDGTNWVTKNGDTETGVGYGDVTFGNNMFVAVGNHGSIWTSTNGETWTKQTNPNGDISLNGVTYGNGLYMVVGDSGVILTSQDGINWTKQVSGTTNHLESVCFNHGVYVITNRTNGDIYNTINNTSEMINNPPTTPPFINHDATTPKTLDNKIIITWGASTDQDGDSITYDLYFYNGKGWIGVKSGLNDLTYSHSIPITSYNTKEAKYKIRAYDGQLYSDFIESSPFELYGVIDESSMNSEDIDLGALSKAPTIVYTVDDEDMDDILSVSTYLDDDLIKYDNDVERNETFSYDLSSLWAGLDTDDHTFILSVTDGEATSRIRFLFSKFIQPTYYPTISGYDTNLGQRNYSFSQTYYVDDLDETKTLTVTEKIDENVNVFTPIRKKINTIDLSSTWSSLSKGVHKIKITVVDENGNSSTRIYNFFKGDGTNHAPTINMII